jgi:hypothetical protein
MHNSPKWLAVSMATAALLASPDRSPAQDAPKEPTPELEVAPDGRIVPAGKSVDRVPQTSQMVFEGTGAGPQIRPCAGRSALTAEAAETLVRRVAEAEDFYPDFVLAVARRESRFDPNALSETGAYGLMQLRPATAERFGVDRCDPEDNVRGGIRYLRVLWERLRNPFYILAAYNAGEAAVAEHRGVPPFPETVGFIAAVISDFYGYPPPNAPGGSARRSEKNATAPAITTAQRQASPIRRVAANSGSTRTSRSVRAAQPQQDWLVLHVE